MGGGRGGLLFCFVFCRIPEVRSGKLKTAQHSECFEGSFFFSRTTGTLGAKGDCGEDVNRWSLRIADRVGWNTGQDLPPEDCAWDIQMMREEPHGEPCSVENHKVENEKR